VIIESLRLNSTDIPMIKLKIYLHIFTLLLFSSFGLEAKITDFELDDVIEHGIDIDLRNPTYIDGTLFTNEGGIITAPNIRIQARTITYTRDETQETITAEGDLLVEFGEYVFVGQSLDYNLKEGTGTIINGRTSVEPWFFAGDTIELCADQSIIIHHGFITTSPSCQPDWAISSNKTTLKDRRYVTSTDVKFKILNVPLFWLPKFHSDLKMIFDSPIRYGFRFGGKQGPRLRMIYEVFSWYRLKTFLRFDYRLNRGPGLGFITHYNAPDKSQHLEMINYFARDSSINNPSEVYRYRFQGLYYHSFNSDRTQITANWDKLSDKEMPEDYHDESLKIEEAGKTELLIRHQENSWITNLATKLQVNGFQTVKQELPSVEWRFHPYAICNTGVISETLLRAGFLDYDYATNLRDVHDYSSTRFEFRQNFYRPFSLGPIRFLPEAGVEAMYYGNSPQRTSRDLVVGLFTLQANTHMYQFFGDKKHVLEPYIHYEYYTFPTTNPDDHFIFDIEDGWYYLNTLRLGLNNNIYFRSCDSGCVHRYLNFDLFTYAFFETETIPETFQKIYCKTTFNFFNNLKHTITTAWNLQENQLDHFNYRVEWTDNGNFAIATEFRHRSAYDWRKADHHNFILDSFHSVEELLNSPLSDRRDTLLIHTFYRFHPYWAMDFEVRQGWNRKFEPSYTEYQADLITNLGSAWNLKLSYQHREDDHRIAFYFSLGAKKPNRKPCYAPPCIEF
jgi:hypothetical protein